MLLQYSSQRRRGSYNVGVRIQRDGGGGGIHIYGVVGDHAIQLYVLL